MSKSAANEASFDVIEEIPDDDLPHSRPSTSGVTRSAGKFSKKSTTSSSSPSHGPSTSRGTGGGPSINNYIEISSDTSSAAGFKMDNLGGNSSAAVSACSTPGHHPGKPLTPEIEPLHLDESLVIDGGGGSPAGDAPVTSARSAPTTSNLDYLLSLLPPAELTELPVDDPIIIRGNGNMTLFGLSNSFTPTFPSSLLGRVSREEFEYTMGRINGLLRQQHSTNAKFLLLGCLCCCCSLGCSLLWPTFALSKRTRNSLEKLLAMENSRMYNKLGLNWRLTKQHCHTNHSFMEYILVIDFLPKMQIYQPD